MTSKLTNKKNQSFYRTNVKTINNKLMNRLKAGDQPNVNRYPIKLILPDDLTVTFTPDSDVKEIILFQTGMKIVSEKSTDNYDFRNIEKSAVLSSKFHVTKNEPAPSVSQTTASKKPWGVSSCRKTYNIDLEPKSSSIRKKTSSIKQKKSNILQKTSSIKRKTSSIRKKIHKKGCTNENCICPSDTNLFAKDKLKKEVCKCPKPFCTCDNLFSVCATCAIEEDLKVSEFVSVLAWNIYQFFESDPKKIALLQKMLNTIIDQTIKDLNETGRVKFSDLEKADLKKALKWILDNKDKKPKQMTKDEALYIIQTIREEIAQMTLPIHNKILNLPLTKINNYYHHIKYVLFDDLETDSAKKIQNIKHLLANTPLPRSDIYKILKITEQNLIKFYREQLIKKFDPPVLGDERCRRIIKYIRRLIDIASQKNLNNVCNDAKKAQIVKQMQEKKKMEGKSSKTLARASKVTPSVKTIIKEKCKGIPCAGRIKDAGTEGTKEDKKYIKELTKRDDLVEMTILKKFSKTRTGLTQLMEAVMPRGND